MKILFYTPFPPSKERGACKVVLELAEELAPLGWHCTVIGPPEVAAALTPAEQSLPPKEQLRSYLVQNAGQYDVVDYEHPHLPFPRADFDPKPLFVARSVMLRHHLDQYGVPVGRGLKARLGQIVKGKQRREARRQDVADSTYSLQQADLVNVCNDDEKETVLNLGIPADKVIVLPFGISRSRRPLFDAIPSAVPAVPRVAFVGTFDYRKGANEFPAIAAQIAAQVPNVRFRLLGTAGMFPTREAVLAHFPKQLWPILEIVPQYPADELPARLEACSVGLFPSRIEGFPFGVLEMLAASLPVFAYDVPGPRATLPAEYLVRAGDAAGMSRAVAALLRDEPRLAAARVWAKQTSQRYQWNEVAAATHAVYSARLADRRGSTSRLSDFTHV